MSFCSECGSELSQEAKFCSNCGASNQVGEEQPYRLDKVVYSDWLRFDDVINDKDRRLGAIGTLLAFLAAFCPWTTHSVGFLGITAGSYSAGSPFAWLVALAAIAAAVFLFRHESGSVVMAIGIVIGAFALLSLIMAFGNHGSPSLGILLALAGGGLVAYSGHLMRQGEGGQVI